MAKKREINDVADQGNKIPLTVLENWLFGAADILRGPIDASDFKTYIFPLLFFKRICDVYDEEFEKAMRGIRAWLTWPQTLEPLRLQPLPKQPSLISKS